MIPLITSETRSTDCDQLIQSDPSIAYWWGTPLEIDSSLYRRYREGFLIAPDLGQARRAAGHLLGQGIVVTPTDRLRALASQLVGMHPLRAADALQLAAAIATFGSGPGSSEFVCLDQRLRAAALAEGLTVLP